MRNTTQIDPVTNLIYRDGHLIGRAVPRMEQPPFGPKLLVYQLLDRQGISYGFGATGRHPSFFETAEVRAAAIPSYMDQPAADGEMLTRLKQKRDLAIFSGAPDADMWTRRATQQEAADAAALSSVMAARNMVDQIFGRTGE